jgi:serine/threonine protein kinase
VTATGEDPPGLGKAPTTPVTTPPAATVACPECGAPVPAGEMLCTTCGASMDDSAAKALIGSVVLGVYTIDSVLGQGGMSVVYRGRHKLTEQVVALKIMPPELAVHAALRARFLEEAKALARLEHPNIVRLYHFGEEGGRFVLAMQLVEGETFEHRIFRQGKVPWAEAARVACEVLRALDYAHGRGIVHRDIKPSNVIVRPDGSAMVMDFGIAKITQESSRLTATGQTMGTVRYMSPEQVRGQSVGLESDLYSLGAALFEAITGETPFDGDTHFDIMMKHLNEAPPSARARGADIPAELDAVLQKSLAKTTATRYRSAADFLAALEALLAGQPVPEAPSGDGEIGELAHTLEPTVGVPVVALRRRRAWLWLALAAVVAAAAGVVGFLVLGKQRATEAAPGVAPAPRPGWPEPMVVPAFAAKVDQKFDGAEQVRVLAARDLDAAHLAATYVEARNRFSAYLRGRGIKAEVTLRPLNLVVASPAVMCDAALYAPNPVPADCTTVRTRYRDQEATLYVLDSDSLERISIPQGAAAHLCRSTPALLEIGCNKDILPLFYDEIEKAE